MRSIKIIVIIALALGLHYRTEAQEIKPQWHPDGRLGALSLTLGGLYHSITEPAGLSLTDIQQFSTQTTIVPTAQLSLLAELGMERGDSTIYQFGGGLRLYLRNPLDGSLSHNADGPIGGPVVTGLVSVRHYDAGDQANKMTARASLLLPVSTRFSLGGSYSYFEEIRATDIDQWTVNLRFYPIAYSSDQNYINPDGSVGNLGIALTVGGSENGSMGQMELIFPISPTTTLRTLFRYEEFEPSPRKALTAGGSISWYPSY